APLPAEPERRLPRDPRGGSLVEPHDRLGLAPRRLHVVAVLLERRRLRRDRLEALRQVGRLVANREEVPRRVPRIALGEEVLLLGPEREADLLLARGDAVAERVQLLGQAGHHLVVALRREVLDPVPRGPEPPLVDVATDEIGARVELAIDGGEDRLEDVAR